MCAKHVHSFLGLVWYLSTFLPNLATHTSVLDKLTMKECDKKFPQWSHWHQVCQELDGSWMLGVSRTVVLWKQEFSGTRVKGSDESAELKLDRRWEESGIVKK